MDQKVLKISNGLSPPECAIWCVNYATCLGYSVGKKDNEGDCYFTLKNNVRYKRNLKYDSYRKECASDNSEIHTFKVSDKGQSLKKKTFHGYGKTGLSECMDLALVAEQNVFAWSGKMYGGFCTGCGTECICLEWENVRW